MAVYTLASFSFLVNSICLGFKITNDFRLHTAEILRLNLNSIVLLNRELMSFLSKRQETQLSPLVLFADGVVVWRMHMLCRLGSWRRAMLVPFIMLGATFGILHILHYWEIRSCLTRFIAFYSNGSCNTNHSILWYHITGKRYSWWSPWERPWHFRGCKPTILFHHESIRNMYNWTFDLVSTQFSRPVNSNYRHNTCTFS
jgi:hypothetical protein